MEAQPLSAAGTKPWLINEEYAGIPPNNDLPLKSCPPIRQVINLGLTFNYCTWSGLLDQMTLCLQNVDSYCGFAQ